jgi:hypothetical protein
MTAPILPRATITTAATFFVMASTQFFMNFVDRVLTGPIVATGTVAVTAVAVRATVARASVVTKTNFGMAVAVTIHDVDSMKASGL